MRWIRWFLLAGLLLAACGSAPDQSTSSPSPPTQSQATSQPSNDTDERATLAAEGVRMNPRIEDIEPIHPSQRVPKDGIKPIYQPEFQPADQAPLTEDELVLGVEIDGEAKAYPISVMRFREMVNDQLGETPILVTW